MRLNFIETGKHFFNVSIHFVHPPVMNENFTSLLAHGIISNFNFIHLNDLDWYLIIVLICIFLLTTVMVNLSCQFDMLEKCQGD
jgi:hypothetical protein